MTYAELIQFCMFIVTLICFVYKICNEKKKEPPGLKNQRLLLSVIIGEPPVCR